MWRLPYYQLSTVNQSICMDVFLQARKRSKADLFLGGGGMGTLYRLRIKVLYISVRDRKQTKNTKADLLK